MLTRSGLAVLAGVPLFTLLQFVLVTPLLLFTPGVFATDSTPMPVWVVGLVAAVVALADIALGVWAIGCFVVHARRNPRLSRTARSGWIAGLVVLAPFVTIVYWLVETHDCR